MFETLGSWESHTRHEERAALSVKTQDACRVGMPRGIPIPQQSEGISTKYPSENLQAP